MALVDSGIAAQAVKIPFAIYIPDKYPCAAVKDDRDGMIIVCAVFLFQFQVGTRQIGQGLLGRR
jgi:hypothetical protein